MPGGLVTGATHRSPAQALVGWPGPGLLAFGYARSASRYARALAVFGAMWAAAFLYQSWTSPGAIPARSERGTSVGLTGSPAVPPYALPAPRPRVAILADGALPAPFPCTAPDCRSLPASSFQCESGLRKTETVVLSGHSLPPRYLGLSPDALAERIACLDPRLLVLDTCYGFSAPLLDALVARGVSAVVVGPREQVAYSGLRYRAGWLQESSPVRRAGAISGTPGRPLQTWAIDRHDLQRAHALTRGYTTAQLIARLKRVHPNLIDVPLKPGVSALFLIPAERFSAQRQDIQ